MTTLQKIITVFILLLCTSTSLSAQRLLQIEKYGAPNKLVRFYPGDEITFQLKTAPGWFTRVINDLDPQENLILFAEEGFIHINEIAAIKKRGSKQKLSLIHI